LAKSFYDDNWQRENLLFDVSIEFAATYGDVENRSDWSWPRGI